MSRNDVINGWPGATDDQRFDLFVDWVFHANVALGGAHLAAASFFRVATLASGNLFDVKLSGALGTPAIQLAVLASVFTAATPDQALTVGDSVLVISVDFAEEAEHLSHPDPGEDPTQELIDEWLDEMKAELFDEIYEAYEAMAEYFAEKLEEEEDVSS